MFTRLKICGITDLNNALRVVHCGVDMLGFNFYPKSPRYISPEDSKKIIDQLPFYVQKVGIFVQPTLDEIEKAIKVSGITAVQLYTSEKEVDLIQISVPVILGVRLKNQMNKFIWPIGARMVLVDSFSTKQYGGTGETFNWKMIPNTIPKDKLILAGGINTNNIKEALEYVHPAIIDVASGAEIEPGVKNIEKIQLLMKNILEFNLCIGNRNNDTK